MRKKKDTHSFDFRPLGLAIREAREKAGLSRNDLGDKVFYGGPSEIVIVPALDGEYGFMAHHDDMVVAMKPGELRFKKPDGTWEYAVVGGGVAQSANNRVTILVDSAERPEDIDEVRAREAMERAQEQLRQKQSIYEYRMSKASLARAVSRLKEKKRMDINL